MDLTDPTRDGFGREESRVPFAGMALVVRGEQAWVCELQDLSASGCGLFRPTACTLEVGDVVRLYFFEAVGATIPVDGRVARIDFTSIGIEYYEPQSIPPGAP